MLDWSKISTVFLDLDGTLLDLYYDNHFWLEYIPQCYADKHQLALEDSHKTLREKYAEAYGSLNWYCVEYWSRELQLDIGALKQSIHHKISVRPYVEEFLESLHMLGKRVVLLTNAHPVSIEIKMNKTGLGRYFDRVISSHELHYAKEHDEFWRKLEQVEAVKKSASLFIDDNFDVLDAAGRYGISYLLAIRKPDSREEDKSHEHYHLLDSFEDIMPN